MLYKSPQDYKGVNKYKGKILKIHHFLKKIFLNFSSPLDLKMFTLCTVC